jgi:Domain of unknown function (DUF1707)
VAYGPGQAGPPYPVPSEGPGGVWYADGSTPFPGAPSGPFGGPAAYAVHPGWLAATADRERTVGVLRAAFTEGRLSQDELDERIGLAYASRTYGDLWQLTSDLPSGPLPYPAQVPAVIPFPQDPATPPGAQVSSTWSSAAALVITALVIFTLAALVTAIATAHTGQPIGGFQHVQHAYLAPYITADGNA